MGKWQIRTKLASSSLPADACLGYKHWVLILACVLSLWQQREKIEGPVWELQKGMFETSPSNPDPKSWQPFAEEPKQQTTTPKSANPSSVRTTNGLRNTLKQQSPTASAAEWGFGQESFKAAPSGGGSEISRSPLQGSTSQRFAGSQAKKAETGQPAGWAGF